jgi:hypothetical protein
MAARHRPTDDDRRTVIEIALSGLARGDDLGDIAGRLAPLQPRDNTFPGEVLLDLAADAIGVSGATRQLPLEFEGIRDRYLPEAVAHTKARYHKSKYALRAAAMLHGGVDPGLLDECSGGAATTCATGRWRRWRFTSVPPPTASPSPSRRCADGSPTNTGSRTPGTSLPEAAHWTSQLRGLR